MSWVRFCFKHDFMQRLYPHTCISFVMVGVPFGSLSTGSRHTWNERLRHLFNALEIEWVPVNNLIRYNFLFIYFHFGICNGRSPLQQRGAMHYYFDIVLTTDLATHGTYSWPYASRRTLDVSLLANRRVRCYSYALTLTGFVDASFGHLGIYVFDLVFQHLHVQDICFAMGF